MINLQDWLRFDNSSATNSYYGYNLNPSNTDGSNTWAIKKIVGTGPSNVYWNNNCFISFEASWANRTYYFSAPTNISTLTATVSKSVPYSVTFNWSSATGSSRYYASLFKDNSELINLLDANGYQHNPHQNTSIKQVINGNSITIANCSSATYSIYLYADNGFGTSSTVTTSISI